MMFRPSGFSLVMVAFLGCATTPPPAPAAPAVSAEASSPTPMTEAPMAPPATSPVAETPPASPETPAPTPETPAPETASAPGGDVARGQAAFQRICATCHEPGDREGPRPGLNWPEARLRTLIRNGNRRMRAIPTSRLSDADLVHLFAHLRATRVIR